ncbi:unnamed protein product, partial [Prorocentrum cordatum]
MLCNAKAGARGACHRCDDVSRANVGDRPIHYFRSQGAPSDPIQKVEIARNRCAQLHRSAAAAFAAERVREVAERDASAAPGWWPGLRGHRDALGPPLVVGRAVELPLGVSDAERLSLATFSYPAADLT